MKKVIITGATGQDGSYMIEYLLENTDCEVLGATRRTSQPILNHLKKFLDNKKFRLVHIDLNDIHSITSLIKQECPDYFINFGASTFVPDSWIEPALVMQTNAISLIHILEAVKNYAPECRVYSSGSSEQWGDVLSSPQNEKTEMRPRSIYGVSKCTASMICKTYRESYGLYVVHGMLLNHESPKRQEYFVTRKITKGVARIYHALKNRENFEPIELGNLDVRRDWSHAKDFISGIWMMINQEQYNIEIMKKVPTISNKKNLNFLPCSGTFHITQTQLLSRHIKGYVLASNKTYSVREFVEKAFLTANIQGNWIFEDDEGEMFVDNNNNPLVVINPKFFRPAEVELLHGDSTLIKKELGWEPKITFNELVSEMVFNDIKLLT